MSNNLILWHTRAHAHRFLSDCHCVFSLLYSRKRQKKKLFIDEHWQIRIEWLTKVDYPLLEQWHHMILNISRQSNGVDPYEIEISMFMPLCFVKRKWLSITRRSFITWSIFNYAWRNNKHTQTKVSSSTIDLRVILI